MKSIAFDYWRRFVTMTMQWLWNTDFFSRFLGLTWLQRMKTIFSNNWRSFVSMAIKKAALLPGLSFSFVFRTWNRLFSNLCCVQFGGVHSYAIVRHVLVWCHRYALSNHRATISAKKPPGSITWPTLLRSILQNSNWTSCKFTGKIKLVFTG